MRTILLSLLLLTSLVGQGQRQQWNLDTDYGIKPGVDKARTLTEAGLTVAAAKAKYPRWYARWIAKGGTDATFMNNGTFTAAYMDAFFTGQAHNLASTTAASAKIVIPWGEYWTTCQLYAPFGSVEGSGAFCCGGDMGSTVLSPWHERWNAEPGTAATKRNVMVSAQYGVDGYAGYHEGCTITGIRFEGRKLSNWYDPSYESSGLVVWDAGENFNNGVIRADNFNDYGVASHRGTPFQSHNLTTFWNNRAGVGIIGTALNTYDFGILSADDNPWILSVTAGTGREAGGSINVGAIKDETGTTPENITGQKHKAQGIAELRGQFNVVIGVVNLGAEGGLRASTAFLVDPRISNGSPQASRLVVHGMKAHGYDNVVMDVFNNKRWPMPCEYCAFSLVYDAAGGGTVTINGKVVAPIPYTCGDRLGVSTSYDYTNCTPKWNVSGTGGTPPPNPTPCTYSTGAWSAWSTCTNGTQTRTRTVTATPSGCTGTPPASSESQSCTITPPPPTSTIAHYTFNSGTTSNITATVGANMTQSTSWLRFSSLSGGQVSNSRASATYPVNWPGVTTITLTGLKWNGTPNYQMILGNAQGKGLIVLPDGGIVDNTSGGDVQVAPTGSVKAGTAVNLTLKVSPMDITFFGARPGAGNCWVGSLDELKVQ